MKLDQETKVLYPHSKAVFYPLLFQQATGYLGPHCDNIPRAVWFEGIFLPQYFHSHTLSWPFYFIFTRGTRIDGPK